MKLSNKHLKGINISPLNPGAVLLIIGTDFPELQIHLDFPSGEPSQGTQTSLRRPQDVLKRSQRLTASYDVFTFTQF